MAATLGACVILAVATALAIAWGAAVAHGTTEIVGVGATSVEVNETRSIERPYETDRLHAELVAATPGTATEVGG